MKRILFLALSLVVGITSCSKDENKKEETQNPLIGTWYHVQTTGENPSTDCDKKSYHLFTEKQFQYVLFEDNSDKTDCVEKTNVTHSYTISGDKIIVTNNNETLEMRFKIEGDKLYIYHPQGGGREVEEIFEKK